MMEEQELSPVSSSILSTLAYFSIFRHPLLKSELYNYCHFNELCEVEFQEELGKLKSSGLVAELRNYFFLTGEDEHITRRISGEANSAFFLDKAKKYSRIMSHFPFVRAVFVSGSLSKGYMDGKSDIDYFIITEPKRLWLCRTLLILYKKIFLLNSHKHFCVNYFIDTDQLQIPDKNIFTATELVFVLPMYNGHLFRSFRKDNRWTRNYYPNLENESRKVFYEYHEPKIRMGLEKLLSGKTGEWLDSWCFKKTIGYWKRKFSDFDEEAFDLNLRSKRNVSKHHPRGFQSKVLDLYNQKIQNLEKTYGIKLCFKEINALNEQISYSAKHPVASAL